MSMPAIDYTDKDFASLRAAMLRLASQRLPEWTDRSPADLIMVLIDLFAYCGDITAYYQDRIASELFPATATERAGLVDLLRLIGYEFSPATPARTDLVLTFDRSDATATDTVTIPQGTRFRAEMPIDGPIEFTYTGTDLTIDLRSDQVRRDPDTTNSLVYYDRLPVEQGRQTASDPIGSGTGEANQTYALRDKQVNVDSVVIEVNEGAELVRWHQAPDNVPSTDPLAREYRLINDATDTPRVIFPSRRPPVAADNILARYRVVVGARGNLDADTIVEAVDEIPGLAGVTNPHPAAGGTDLETAEHAVRSAPQVFRSLRRAVTADDYAALTRSTGAVEKVRVHSPSANRVDLYVAPAGERLTPLSESLRNYLLAYFEDKRSLGTTVKVFGAVPVTIEIDCEVVADERFAPATVIANIRTAVNEWLSFKNVDFGQTLYVSDVYAVVESVPGVVGVSVSRFRRSDQVRPDIQAELARSGLPPLDQLPDFLRAAVVTEIDAGGRIDLGQFEMPMLGAFNVRRTLR